MRVLTERVGSHSGTDVGTDAGQSWTMTKSTNDAPDPDSQEFLAEQNTVEKVSPNTTADEPATDAALISTDPTPNQDPPTS
jgi:hypothetical protein